MGIARVLRSDARSYDVGNYVLTWQLRERPSLAITKCLATDSHHLAWSRYSTLRPEAIEKKIDNPGNIPWYKFLTVFGWTALTAWCGYKLFAQAKKVRAFIPSSVSLYLDYFQIPLREKQSTYLQRLVLLDGECHNRFEVNILAHKHV